MLHRTKLSSRHDAVAGALSGGGVVVGRGSGGVDNVDRRANRHADNDPDEDDNVDRGGVDDFANDSGDVCGNDCDHFSWIDDKKR
jgi:hypothetical protein